MGCDGFHKGARRTLERWIAEDPFFGHPFSVGEAPDFEPASIDGCTGLRLVLRATGEGSGAPVLDLRIVAHDGTLALVGLRSTAGELDKDREPFEQGVSTLTLAATH